MSGLPESGHGWRFMSARLKSSRSVLEVGGATLAFEDAMHEPPRQLLRSVGAGLSLAVYPRRCNMNSGNFEGFAAPAPPVSTAVTSVRTRFPGSASWTPGPP